jgi:hypothetical protein
MSCTVLNLSRAGMLPALCNPLKAEIKRLKDEQVANAVKTAALMECAKMLKECLEPCPISEEGLNDLRARCRAALDNLEKVK